MEGILIAPDWLWIGAACSLVLFGIACGYGLVLALRVNPLEKRLRHAEKVLAVNDAVYRLHYKHIRREQDLHDARLIAMAREMPTHPPPAHS